MSVSMKIWAALYEAYLGFWSLCSILCAEVFANAVVDLLLFLLVLLTLSFR